MNRPYFERSQRNSPAQPMVWSCRSCTTPVTGAHRSMAWSLGAVALSVLVGLVAADYLRDGSNFPRLLAPAPTRASEAPPPVPIGDAHMTAAGSPGPVPAPAPADGGSSGAGFPLPPPPSYPLPPRAAPPPPVTPTANLLAGEGVCPALGRRLQAIDALRTARIIAGNVTDADLRNFKGEYELTAAAAAVAGCNPGLPVAALAAATVPAPRRVPAAK